MNQAVIFLNQQLNLLAKRGLPHDSKSLNSGVEKGDYLTTLNFMKNAGILSSIQPRGTDVNHEPARILEH